MAYFARGTEAPRHSPKRRGSHKPHGVVDIAPPAKEVPSREHIIERNIQAMQDGNKDGKSGAGVLRYVHDTEHKHKATRSQHHKPDSDIFGPPTIAPKPTPRVRTGVSDDELKKIWAEDDRKAAAQTRMQHAPTMVEKMVAEPVNPIFPSGKPKDAASGPRKQVNLLSGTMESRNRDANEPAGFGGMGRQSQPQHRHGRAAMNVPESAMEKEPKKVGRRTKFPENTLSFQDDSQTY